MQPDFAPEEYEARVAKAQALMAERGLDAWLLSCETSLRYLTGHKSPFGEVSPDAELALLPAEGRGEAALVVSSNAEPFAARSWIGEVRTYPSGGGQHRATACGAVAELLRLRGLWEARIGIELGVGFRRNLAPARFDDLRHRMPAAQFIDVSDSLSQLRRIKSPAELDVIREACRVSCAGFEAGLTSLRAGMSEKDLAAIVCSRMLESGREAGLARQWFLTVNAGNDLDTWSDPLPTDHRLQPGEMVMLDGGYIHVGYHTDFIRSGAVGSVSADEQRLHDLVVDAGQAARQAVRPGSTCNAVFQAALRVFGRAGIDGTVLNELDGFGHGVGLDIREGPYIEPGEMTELQPGMVMAVEPWLPNLANPGRAPALFATEDMVVVTDDGCQLLTHVPPDLRVA